MKHPASVYQSIVAPLLPLLKKEADQLKKDNYTLSLSRFTLNLCYCVIAQIQSIRLLITESQTADTAKSQGVVVATSSMYSEAFNRYNPLIFKRLFFGLLSNLEFKSVPEISKLGRCVLVDGSIFPAIKSMDWANYKKTANGIKLHLAFELNRMIPVQFISTEANGCEKKALRALVEAEVTYVADRGYVAFDLFKQIAEQSAFFVIRVRANMDAVVKQSLLTDLPDSWKAHLSNVSDHLVIFKGDQDKATYRLITFEALGESYRIASNRRDLKTHEIIMLYAYRWQIELFFRCLKRGFNGLHLWSHEAKGIEIQFYLYLIVYLLLLSFKQGLHDSEEAGKADEHLEIASCIEGVKQDSVAKEMPSRTPACGIVTLLGDRLKKLWKIGIHWLMVVKNTLGKPMTDEVIHKLNSV